MSLDLTFYAFNRLEFTRASFGLLLANTNWDLVDRLLIFDDGSTDGTREFLDDHISLAPVSSHLTHCGWGSPVRIMNHYLGTDPADWFVKIDNDIAVPPGWLDSLVETAARHPELELLGMEAGQTDVPDAGPWDGVYRVQRCSHIGGVGLMRTSAFLSRPRPQAHGRFGFDQWQQEQRLARAWITPDLPAPQLDRIPAEPWQSWSAIYRKKLWQRAWGPYDPTWQTSYWDWIGEAVAA